MNEVCANCGTEYLYDESIGIRMPSDHCECGGALRSIADPSPKLKSRGAGPHRNQRPFGCSFGVTLGRPGMSEMWRAFNQPEDVNTDGSESTHESD